MHAKQCVLCEAKFKAKSKGSRPICNNCRKVPAKLAKAVWIIAKQRMQERIDADAERDTRALKKGAAFTPLEGERIIELMKRGEW